MNYKEVFQLAQDKGYKLTIQPLLARFMYEGVQLHTEESLNNLSEYDTAYFNQCIKELDQDIELLELALIQKWLRDEHKINVVVFPFWSDRTGGLLIYKGRIFLADSTIEKEVNQPTYEEALLQGISEALKLI